MHRLVLAVAAALLVVGCRGPEDHRADTTVGPTPVGRAGLSSVPPRPARTSDTGIAYWTVGSGLAIAAGLNVEPLPSSVQRRAIDGAAMAFDREQLNGSRWVCPRVRTLYAVSDAESAQRWITDALGRAGYAILATPRLADIDTSTTPIVQGVAADRTFEVALSLSRADPTAAKPFDLLVEFVQLCGG